MLNTLNLKDLKLNKNNFVAQGGEGQIYRDNDIVYKIYHDLKKAMPLLKIQELSKITDKNVIIPLKIVANDKKEIVGYSMKYLKDTYSMCQYFTKAFKDRNKISLETTINLIKNAQKTINNIHSKDILIVDLNELNLLLDYNFKEIYFIDTDSYQTPHFPATAIMDSIKDRHSKNFSEMTDWFSFGVITYQMFIGIHPFKGTHPKIKTMEERMLKNVPAFHPDVSIPKVCYPFNSIPEAYREWYRAIFLKGERVSPPTDAVVIISPLNIQSIIKGNDKFEITELFKYNNKIVKFYSYCRNNVCFMKNNDISVNNYIINKDYSNFSVTPNNKIILSKICNEKLVLFDITNKIDLQCDIFAEEIMYLDGRIYIKQKNKISEITYIELPNKIIPVATEVTTVNESSTKFYDGVILQDILGSCVACIFPQSKTAYQIKIKEVIGYKIVDAKYLNKVLIIIANKNGKYVKFIFRMNEFFNEYSVRKIDDIIYSGINFTVSKNGVTVHITEEEKVEMFSNKYNDDNIVTIEDTVISGDMILSSDENNVLFYKENSVYKIKVKQ